MSTMKAIIWSKYGSPKHLEVKEIPMPEIKSDEILIKIHASSLTLGDCEIRGSYLPMWTRIPVRIALGVFRPRIHILGQEYAGEVTAIGSEVTKFNVGDRVLAHSGIFLGGHGQYRTIKENPGMGIICHIHPQVSYKEAATLIVGGINGKYFSDLAHITAGQNVLINGAAGSIGSFAIQLAKLSGAVVTAVDHGDKAEFMRELGADYTIDYRSEDFTKNGEQYDAIIDIVGKASLSRAMKSLTKNGIYLSANPRPSYMLRGMFINWFSSKTAKSTTTDPNIPDLEALMELIAEKKITVPFDKEYSLDQAVEAHEYLETGMKEGHVIFENLQ